MLLKKILLFMSVCVLVACSQLPRHVNVVQHEDISTDIYSLLSDKESIPFSGVILVDLDEYRIYEHAQGYYNVPAMSLHQPFVIADLAKQMTAVMALRLVDQGMIGLHTPIREYLPELGLPYNVTLHQLLTHTGNPQKQFIYNNAGYDLIGKLISRITLTSFEEQIDNLAQRCGMKHTFAKEKGDRLFFKLLYPEYKEGWREWRGRKLINDFLERDPRENPSLGIISTPKDFMRWGRCLHGEDLLSDEAYDKMFTSYVDIDHRWGRMGYGYGVQVGKTFGSTEISHSGIVPGFKTTNIYYPAEKVNVLILENLTFKNNSRGFEIHDGIRKIIIDKLITPMPRYDHLK